jgi:hypothetical protein
VVGQSGLKVLLVAEFSIGKHWNVATSAREAVYLWQMHFLQGKVKNSPRDQTCPGNEVWLHFGSFGAAVPWQRASAVLMSSQMKTGTAVDKTERHQHLRHGKVAGVSKKVPTEYGVTPFGPFCL